MNVDQAHVLLDAAAELREQVKAGKRTPWVDYDGGADDPKVTEAGYCQTLDEAINELKLIVSQG